MLPHHKALLQYQEHRHRPPTGIKRTRTNSFPCVCLRVLVLLLRAETEGKTLTLRELAEIMGVHLSRINPIITRLKEHGLVKWEWNKQRTLRTTCRLERE